MLSLLSSIPYNVTEQLESPRWILLAVCVVGVALAYVTDEGYSLLPSEVANNMKTTTTNMKASTTTTTMISPLSAVLYPLGEVLPTFIISLLTTLHAQCRKLWVKFDLYRASIALKKMATTKRQYFYLLEKKLLGLPIREGETEIDSYIDCKHYLKGEQNWPFMWEVSNVKAERVKCNGEDCLPMSSYSYLDLLRDERVQEAAITAAKQWSSGNHGPRMLGGNTSILLELEKCIAKFFGRDDTLLCATGYLACMSACAAVASEDAVIFADSRLHASLRAGLKIGDAKVIYFRHNNFEDAEKHILQERSKFRNSWMVIESVYSMDGDLCDLPAAHKLCKKYDIKLMIDEAHGLGVIGSTGRGVEEHFNLKGCADVIVGTFSKSIASIGGYITGDSKFIDYLDFHAPGNVFSAPLPAYCAGAAIKSFELIDAEPEIVTKAQSNSRRLRELLATGCGLWPASYPEALKYELGGDPASTVLPVVFRDDIDRVMRIASRLKKEGFMCSAVAYPACPLREPRFRITATSAYTEELMMNFAQTLVRVCIDEEASKLKQEIS